MEIFTLIGLVIKVFLLIPLVLAINIVVFKSLYADWKLWRQAKSVSHYIRIYKIKII